MTLNQLTVLFKLFRTFLSFISSPPMGDLPSSLPVDNQGLQQEWTNAQGRGQDRSAPPQATTDGENADLNIDPSVYVDDNPIPLFSPMVDELQHNAFCTLFDLHSCPRVQERFQPLDLTGIPFQAWWSKMVVTRPLDQWKRN